MHGEWEIAIEKVGGSIENLADSPDMLIKKSADYPADLAD
jgi:hypothetical protein